MATHERVNILLVDDQPGKLLSYEVVLKDLGENLIKAGSAREALEHLLKSEIALILIDVCMPDLDGFQLATMIREHPRFQKVAMIFISAVQVEEVDRLRGYAIGAVDYVPVPVVPEVLRAKVRIFIELYRKTRDLELLNLELEGRVAQRTAELKASNERLRQSEERRSLALAAGQMGAWDFDFTTGDSTWDDGQYRIFGLEPGQFRVSLDEVRRLIHPEDWSVVSAYVDQLIQTGNAGKTEFRAIRPDGVQRWCVASAACTFDAEGKVVRVSGVTLDITERKEIEQRQMLLAQEVDHRARNTLAVVQSMLRLTRAESVTDLVATLEGRVRALARAHTLLSTSRWQGADLGRMVAEEIEPYRDKDNDRVEVSGPTMLLRPAGAQTLALALHELATNAAKYGALSVIAGRLSVRWELDEDHLLLRWSERGGPPVAPPSRQGFGTRMMVASIEHGLGGKAIFDWRPEGLQCTLTLPRADVAEYALIPSSGIRLTPAGGPAPVPAPAATTKRVLLVEDEALIAMMMGDMLNDLGYAVTGPVGTQAAAIELAKTADVDVAVLDLSLSDGSAYPVADVLAARGIPFIFVTGYQNESIDPRHAGAGLLQKPVEEQALRRLLASTLGGSAAAGAEAGPSRASA